MAKTKITSQNSIKVMRWTEDLDSDGSSPFFDKFIEIWVVS